MPDRTCPRCDLGDHGRSRRTDGVKHKPTDEVPSLEQVEQWLFDGVAEATDGCTVEPDGHCEHGHSAWTLVMGIV